jgi:hypothetical protein
VRDVDADVHDRIDAIIRDKLVPPRSKKETTSLATIGHRVLRYLPASLDGLSDAAAGATVRSAALVGSPEAMARLAGYAHDPRENVQEALFDAWLNFDPERYADQVLADAPLDDGHVRITTVRLIPHLARLRNLAGLDLFLAPGEELHDLRFVEDMPALRYFTGATPGEVDLSVFKATNPRMLYLYGASRFCNPETLPRVEYNLGLFQFEPWSNLDFLRGRDLANLSLSAPAADCDLSPIAGMKRVRRLSCHGWTDLSVVPAPPGLEEIEIDGGLEEIDVRPLRGRQVNLVLQRTDSHIGITELGPDVRIAWRD